ncbi:MAG: LPS assembly protein LptD [Gammaproteobacteria bacterium]|nr:LPS assembly protein LptD [Gammaproteobacteria bacterium]
MLHPRNILLAGLVSATIFRPSLAAEDWGLCHIPSFEYRISDGLASDEAQAEALSLVTEGKERVQLSGDASLVSTEQRIDADDIFLLRSSEEIRASGNVIFADQNYRLKSPSIHIDNLNDRAEFDQAAFEINSNHARGEAEKIEKLDPYRSRYSDLYYTTCDPDDKAWHLRAAKLEIDSESGIGTAKHTTLYFHEVPFLYLPYFQFPVDDRRLTGIIAPRVGYGGREGATVIVPVYWNIAPNYDMTITPAWYQNLGLQLNTENRYLFENHRGQVDLSYIDDKETNSPRWFKQWQHATALPYDIKTGLLLAETSDGDFFDDYSLVAPQYKDTRHLESHVRFNRDGEFWQSELMWQDYQTLDETTSESDRPYNRLPRFTLDAEPEPWQADIQTPIHLELVNFERDDSITGNRANFVTSLRWNSQQSWYFFEPELQLAFTDYELDNNPEGNSIDRALPTLGIDSGLIFERLAGSTGQWRQTLEPRLYFLFTPYENQDDIPDFDTSLASSTYNNLFKNNRFNGADRIGDAKQVTFGLASRLFDSESGRELLNASAGQIYYFEDRRVSLDGEPDVETRSDLIAEVDYSPLSTVTLATRLVYDPEESDLIDTDFSVNYSNNEIASNFAYYYTKNELEQALVSLAYPIDERWAVVAKIHHSIEFDEPVENLLGINYESCCWGLKILAGQTGDEKEDFAETENSIYFEFTFKGLSQAGQDTDARLFEAIPGYTPGF